MENEENKKLVKKFAFFPIFALEKVNMFRQIHIFLFAGAPAGARVAHLIAS